MCGNHASDGTPIGHHHASDHDHGPGQAPGRRHRFLSRPHPLTRRAFLGNVGKGAMAMAVLSPAALAACSSSDDDDVAVADGERPADATDPTSGPDEPAVAAGDESGSEQGGDADQAAPVSGEDGLEPVMWARTNLGFVSAYVLVRGNSATIVDTGSSGSATAIGETLGTFGLNYSDVANVILTHNHPDHAGSIGEVLEQAVNAAAYAGEADLGSIPGDLTGLTGGEDIFGFEIVHTPGHTAGHMAVIDHQAGLLVAGDAIFTEDGAVVEGPERFFNDVPQSRESIQALAALSFNTLLVGHGEPIESGADAAVRALATVL